MRLGLVFLGLVGVLSIGMLTWRSSATSSPVAHVIVGVDASVSARPDLGRYGAFVTALSQQLTPDHDTLTLFRVERQTQEFRDGLFDGDVEGLLRSLKEAIQPLPGSSCTLPATFWREVTKRVAQQKQSVVIVLLTDGDNDDLRPDSDAAIREAATRLAALPQVRSVLIGGARRENWQRIRTSLAPLGDRVHLLSPTDLIPDRAGELFTNRS